MMDGILDDNDVIIRARSVGEVIKAAAPRIEAAGRLTDDVVSAMHEAGMFRLLLPKSVGGDEVTLRTHAEAMEIIASFDASTAWCMSQGSGCSMSAAFMAPEAAKRMFGPRNAVLAWGAGIQGKAVIVDGGYRVTGTWSFASGSGHATLIGGHSYLYNADGSKVLAEDGRHRDRTMLFAREKAKFHDVWDVMGLRGTASDTFEVTDLFVPADETVDRDNYAECREPGPLYRCSTSLAYGVGFSALQLGLARAMLDALHDLAMTKTPRGAPSSLLESPVFHMLYARLEAKYRAARAYLHSAASRADEVSARSKDWIPLDERVSLKLATMHVIQDAADVVVEAYRAAGATGIFPNSPFERRLRDALTATQQVQARTTNYVTTGRCLLGLEPDVKMFL
ncbi:MAG: acyl-CoA dehydrogenase family protein [Gammaproteobacteria bacterium]|nr:acyl-CoA dehydrogenase family protein [Gammaproteobacteria bacterium]